MEFFIGEKIKILFACLDEIILYPVKINIIWNSFIITRKLNLLFQ